MAFWSHVRDQLRKSFKALLRITELHKCDKTEVWQKAMMSATEAKPHFLKDTKRKLTKLAKGSKKKKKCRIHF